MGSGGTNNVAQAGTAGAGVMDGATGVGVGAWQPIPPGVVVKP